VDVVDGFEQGSLFDEQQTALSGLPVEARMPLNIAGRKVRNMLFKDLCETGDALIVTGYSGLDQLIQLINQRGEDKGRFTANPLLNRYAISYQELIFPTGETLVNNERIETLLEQLIEINEEIKNHLFSIQCDITEIKDELSPYKEHSFAGNLIKEFNWTEEHSHSSMMIKGFDELSEKLGSIELSLIGIEANTGI